MTENERKEIIDTIQKEINEKESLSSKYEKLKKLTNDPKVAEYLQLLEEINKIEDDIQKYKSPINGSINDSLEKRIHFWFRVGRCSCDHKVWMYEGSFYEYTNFKNEEDYKRENSEDLSDNIYTFSYNKYICLECREEIKVSEEDWKNFENTNLVLKSPKRIDTEYYQDLYYQLLYNNCDFTNAQNTIVEEFNKSKVKTKSKKENN